jgi:hypothetical protein
VLAFLVAIIPGGALVTEATIVADGAGVVASAAKFFSTPLGKLVAVGLVGLTLFVAGDWHRARVDRVEWAARIRASRDEAAARDAEIQRQAAAEAAASIKTIKDEAERLKNQVADYETYIKAHGGDACRATPGAARRLRGL